MPCVPLTPFYKGHCGQETQISLRTDKKALPCVQAKTGTSNSTWWTLDGHAEVYNQRACTECSVDNASMANMLYLQNW